MIEFGKTLRSAREAKGLTARQIAAGTHMMIQIVEGLENEDFSRIVAPIYGRGFVKLYCEAVGLDPKPLVAEFMDLYNGERAPDAGKRESAPQPAAKPVPPPVAEPLPSFESPEQAKPAGEPIMETAKESAPRPQTPPVPEAIIPAAVTPVFEPPANSPSRYAAPLPLDDDEISPRSRFDLPALPPNTWRIAVVAIAAALIFWGIVAGVKFIYRATMIAPDAPETTQTPPAEEKTGAPEPAVRGERKALPARPFYVD